MRILGKQENEMESESHSNVCVANSTRCVLSELSKNV